jgi:hypothetical protein
MGPAVVALAGLSEVVSAAVVVLVRLAEVVCSAVVVAGSVGRTGVVVYAAGVGRAVCALREAGGAAVDAGATEAGCACSAIGDRGRVDEAVTAGVSGVARVRAVVGVEAIAAADVAVGAVVPEASAAPVSAVEANAEVAEAIVEATIVADEGAPIAGVPGVAAKAHAPVSGGPECVGVGRFNPGALHPFVTVTGPCPVAGSPDVAVAGGFGLLVVGDGRRGLVGDGCGGLLLCGRAVLVGVALLGLLTVLVLRITGGALLHIGRRTCGAVRVAGWSLRECGSRKNEAGQHYGCERTFDFEETRVRHGFTCLLRLRLSGAASFDRTSRRARMSSSRAGSPRSSAQLIRHEVAAFVAGMQGVFGNRWLMSGCRGGEEGFGAHDVDAALGINELGDVDVAGNGDEGVGIVAGDAGVVGVLLGEEGDHIADGHLGGDFEVFIEAHGDVLGGGFGARPEETVGLVAGLSLMDDELECAGELGFHGGDVDFTVALAGVAVACFEESSLGVDGDI